MFKNKKIENKLKELLVFYSDIDNWNYSEHPDSSDFNPDYIPPVYEDKGKKAKELLNLITEEENKIIEAERNRKLVYESKYESLNK